jgi:CubicO group peptidase (beta-lactamase class C family)
MDEVGVVSNIAAGGIMPALHPDEFMAGYGRLPLLHQPGEQYLYNSGSDILGVLIPRATGMSLGAYVRERLFVPLGMNDTVSASRRISSIDWQPATGPIPQRGHSRSLTG